MDLKLKILDELVGLVFLLLSLRKLGKGLLGLALRLLHLKQQTLILFS